MGGAVEDTEVLGYAARYASGRLSPFKFTRTPRGPEDVTIQVLFCGVCHTDLHQIRNEWTISRYPMVPGHEIIGTVTAVGTAVTKFRIGDTVGVGCILLSCLECDFCAKGLEQCCEKVIWVYNSVFPEGTPTFGGYSNIMMADQRFVLRIPDNLSKDAAAPLLCAGISVWSHMRHFGMNVKGARLGVVGLGGLGHMAVQFGKAFGMHVTIFSTSPAKEKGAREILGADDFVVSKDAKAMKARARSLDFIIDTVPVKHMLEPYLDTLKAGGTIGLLGIPSSPLEITPFQLVMGRHSVVGSIIGGIQETEEMLEFCGKNNITCMVETVPISECNKALERMEKKDVKYRFVLDLKALHK